MNNLIDKALQPRKSVNTSRGDPVRMPPKQLKKKQKFN